MQLPFPERGTMVANSVDSNIEIILYHPLHNVKIKKSLGKQVRPTKRETEKLCDYVVFRFWRYLGAA